MNNKSNLFWGVLLIGLGVLFLGQNLEWFQIHWSFGDIAKYWAILLILAGIAALLHERKTVFNSASAILIAFAIPLALYTCVSDGVGNIKDAIGEDIHIDLDDDEEEDSTGVRDFEKSQYYKIDWTPETKEATLKLKGGAVAFELLNESKEKLFEAKATMFTKNGFTLVEETQNSSKIIDFQQNGKIKGNIHFDRGDASNKVEVSLNAAPTWNLDLGVGVGKLDFDLEKFKVKTLNLQTGAADVEIKLGNLQQNTDVKVEAGLAKVKFKIPKEVACEVRFEGALNEKELDNFQKVEEGLWRTDNFSSSNKKIKFSIEGGLSSFEIIRN